MYLKSLQTFNKKFVIDYYVQTGPKDSAMSPYILIIIDTMIDHRSMCTDKIMNNRKLAGINARFTGEVHRINH